MEFVTLCLDLINAGQQKQQLPSHAFILADLQVTDSYICSCEFHNLCLTCDPFRNHRLACAYAHALDHGIRRGRANAPNCNDDVIMTGSSECSLAPCTNILRYWC